MNTVNDFYNKLVEELRYTYFNSESKFENDTVQKVCNIVELFNNGCMYYENLIKELNTLCNIDVTEIINKYILKP